MYYSHWIVATPAVSIQRKNPMEKGNRYHRTIYKVASRLSVYVNAKALSDIYRSHCHKRYSIIIKKRPLTKYLYLSTKVHRKL